jgi:tetratricopeptide (TPR) repeat protein
MGAFRDSGLGFVLAASLLLTGSALAATAPAKQPAKAPAKPAAAAIVAPALTANDLMAQARQAQTRGETELAVRLAQAAIVAAPDRTDTYVTLGDMYKAQSQPDYARSYYSAALSIDPTDSGALQAVGALDRGATDQRAANIQGSQTGTP